MTHSHETSFDDDIGAFFAPVELKFVDTANPGAFEGYGAVFGNLDSHGDVIAPGAFSASLAEHKARGTMPGLYVEHGQFLGGDPLAAGVWTNIAEDPRGLKVAGKISALDTDYGRRVRSLMQDGALPGLSIAYTVPPGGAVKGKKGNEPARTLTRVNLNSIDLVREPSNPAARIISVKNFASTVEFERFLRSNGVARAAARKLAGGGWPALSTHEETEDDPALVLLSERLDAALLDFKTLTKGR